MSKPLISLTLEPRSFAPMKLLSWLQFITYLKTLSFTISYIFYIPRKLSLDLTSNTSADIWIGLQNIVNNGNFTWLDESPLDFDNWQPGWKFQFLVKLFFRRTKSQQPLCCYGKKCLGLVVSSPT